MNVSKRMMSVSAAVMLGFSTLVAPGATAQTTGDESVQAPVNDYGPTTYPELEWEIQDGQYYSVFEDGERSLNCVVDWNASTILDRHLDDYSNNGFTQKVLDESHGGTSVNYSSIQHWYSGSTTRAFWRPTVAFDADVDDATVVLTLPAAEYTAPTDISAWLVNSYFPSVVPGAPYDTPVSPQSIDISTVGNTTTMTFHLGDVKAGSGFATYVAGDVGVNGVEASMRTTGSFVRGADNGVEDCQFNFGYDDSFTHPSVEVEVNQTGELQVPENTAYEVIFENGQPKVTDADGGVHSGWTVEVDRYTGRLSITPPSDADPDKKYFVHVEATTPDGISQQTTAGVQVAAEVQEYEIRDDGHLGVLINGDWVDLGEVVGQDGEDGTAGETPFIGENGNWWIGTTDTRVPATGADGEDGLDGVDGNTPSIGDNGNWWIGTTDTGIPATGPRGEDGNSGESITIVNQYIDGNGNTVIEFSDGTFVTVNRGECATCGGSSGIGSSDDTDGSSLPVGSSNGSSDARCVQAAATVGIPLLALIPIGLATQVNIPGLSPLVADAQAQLQSINTDIQQQSGVYDDETARLIGQINAELEKNGGAIGQAVGAAAVIAIGGLVGKYLYDNCVPRA